ncbi:DUF4340 domain-containing protein [Hyphobacterium sp. CCMP332]|nr:DUF4340 domain-containing protein [Hyphobacterium sp. CCMP332]
MATKWNNSKLLIVFVVLTAVFLLVRYFNVTRTKGNFNPNVISLDTAEITEILIYPQINNQQEIRLIRENNIWKAQKGELSVNAMKSTVMALINAIQNIKPTRLAARSKEKWEKFQVNDSLATKVKVVYEDGTEMGIMIGKFSYKQAPQANPYQRQQMKTLTYFRLIDQEEVYATDGFLTMTFNRDINAFRDQTFIKTKKEDIRKLHYNLPGEESYILQRVDSAWMIAGEQADDNKVDQVLSKLVINNQSQFADDFEAKGSPDYSLKIEGDNMSTLIIKVKEGDSINVFMNSSLNSEVWFKVNREDLFNDIFLSKEEFFNL